MRKIAIIILLCISSAVNAQNFYFKAGGGYAFPMPGQTADQFGGIMNGVIAKTTTTTSTTTSYTLKNASFLAGIHLVAGLGYMFSKNIGVELNANLNAKPREYAAIHTGLTNSKGAKFDYISRPHPSGACLLVPSFVLQTTDTVFKVYMRAGI